MQGSFEQGKNSCLSDSGMNDSRVSGKTDVVEDTMGYRKAKWSEIRSNRFARRHSLSSDDDVSNLPWKCPLTDCTAMIQQQDCKSMQDLTGDEIYRNALSLNTAKTASLYPSTGSAGGRTRKAPRRFYSDPTLGIWDQSSNEMDLQGVFIEQAFDSEQDTQRPSDSSYSPARDCANLCQPTTLHKSVSDPTLDTSMQRRVRFAEQLEEDPPAFLHAPPARRGWLARYGGRLLAVVSRTLPRGLRATC